MFRAGLACFTGILVLGNCRDPCLWMLCWDKHAWDKQLKGCFGKGTCFLPSFAKSTTECRSAEQIPLPGLSRAPRQPQTLLSFQPTAVPNTGVLASESHNSSATGAIWRLSSPPGCSGLCSLPCCCYTACPCGRAASVLAQSLGPAACGCAGYRDGQDERRGKCGTGDS